MSETMAPPNGWLTEQQAASRLGVTVITVRRMCATGALLNKKFGRKRLIPVAAVPNLKSGEPAPASGGDCRHDGGMHIVTQVQGLKLAVSASCGLCGAPVEVLGS